MHKIMTLLLALVFFTGCKNLPWNKVKSAIGLEAADKYQNQIQDASSFVQLGVWFQKFKIDNSSSTDLAVIQKTPSAYLEGLKAYIDQQLAINADFQSAIKLPDDNARRARIQILLENETLQMKDILLSLIDPQHIPDSGDLFAVYLTQLRRYHSRGIDQFAKEYLAKVYRSRPGSSIMDENNIEQERKNYKFALEKIYLQNPEGLVQLNVDLAIDRSALSEFKQALSANSNPNNRNAFKNTLKGAPAAFLKYNENVMDKVTASGGLDEDQEPIDPTKLSFVQGIPDKGPSPSTSPGGKPTPKPSDAPENASPPNNQGNASCVDSSGAIDQVCLQNRLQQILNPNWQNQNLNPYPLQKIVKSSPKRFCHELADQYSYSDDELINCERRIYGLTVDTSKNKNFIDDSSKLNLIESANNVSIVMRSGNVDDNQGPNGACTAFGLTHTIMANLNYKNNTNNLRASGSEFWKAYAEPIVSTALKTAETYGWIEQSTQKKITVKTKKDLQSASEITAAIDQGYAVYAASQVGGDWMNARDSKGGGGATISCDSLDGDSGHAYSIPGYITKDGKLWFIMKNSWGANWGEQGFAIFPAECIKRDEFGFEAHTLPDFS